MDGILDKAGSYLISLGLPGIVIIVLSAACYKLFNLYNEAQEKRIVESRETLEAINSVNVSISGLKTSIDTITRVSAH